MQPDLTLAKLSLVESADYPVRQAGFFANLDSSDFQPSRQMPGLLSMIRAEVRKLSAEAFQAVERGDQCVDIFEGVVERERRAHRALRGRSGAEMGCAQ